MSKPSTQPVTYDLVRFLSVWTAFSCSSSQYRAFSNDNTLRLTALTPIRSKITYYMYIGFWFGWVFPCSSSEQKPSSRQRHRLKASNAESRIRLIVLLTAPKIFAISLVTDKKIKPQFCKIVGLVLSRGWDTHTRFGIIGKIQNSPCHSERSRRI